MAAITTEEAARRLARVILSDVELYNRERPREGESLDAQYEEGRRLFASRVSPEMLGVFDQVLADRKNGKASGVTAALPGGVTNGQGAAPHGHTNGQVAPLATQAAPADASVTVAPAPATTEISPAAASAVPAAPAAASDDANDFGNDDITATGSAEVKDSLHDEPTRPTLLEDATTEQPPIFEPMAAATSPREASATARPDTLPTRLPTPTPVLKVPTPEPVLKVPTPAPTRVAVAKPATPPPLPKVPTPPPLPLAVALPPETLSPAGPLDTDRAPTPPQPIPIAAVPLAEAPVPELAATPPSGAVPTLKVRVSIPKILLVLAVAAGLVAVIAHFARLSP